MALIAVGVSGGIGAYKAAEVVRGLQKRGHDVVAILTRGAQQFVAPLTFEALTRRAVITDQWAPGTNTDVGHISLTTEVAAAGRRAGHGQRHRQARARPRRRLPDDVRAGDALPDPAGAGDEHADAGAPGGRRRTSRRCAARGVRFDRAGQRLPGVRVGRPGPARRARGHRRRDAATRSGRPGAGAGSRRPSRPGHRRADLRRHRSGALRRQPIERPDGRRAGRGRAPAGRRGDAGARADARSPCRPASSWCACAAPPRCTRR